MICTQECPNFIIDLKRLQTDEMAYLKRCINNYSSPRSYSLRSYSRSDNVRIDITEFAVWWLKNGKLHRDNDQPARIDKDGNRYWYKNGELHRGNDLPAVIASNGRRWWYINGRLHRDNDKPAIIQNGRQYWYRNGKEYEPM